MRTHSEDLERLWRSTLFIATLASISCSATGGSKGEQDTSSSDPNSNPVADASLSDEEVLPIRIRRLTTAEYGSSIRQITETSQDLVEGFPPDSRQAGYTRNHLQTVDSILAGKVSQTANLVASETAALGLSALTPCTGDASDACIVEWIDEFGSRVVRRPLEAEERDQLLDIYRSGVEEVGTEKGLELVISALFQSAGFLYLTELGSDDGGSRVTLTGEEIASQLSYLVAGGPPDDELMQAARDGLLVDPEERRAQAWRLLQQSQDQVTHMIEEWLGIDALSNLGKNEDTYPEFSGLRQSMLDESHAFIGTVLREYGGSLKTLLTADFTVVDQALADHYGLSYPSGATGGQPVSLESTKRRGILTHAAFLSAHSHAEDSSPVVRGVTVLSRLLCVDLPSPAELNIMVTVPAPDPNLTTRQRFEHHVADPECSNCHSLIDPVGFTFEGFGATGESRTTEHGLPVDTSGELNAGTDLDGPAEDAAELVSLIAETDELRRCFARQVFKYASAGATKAAEDAFIRRWEHLNSAQQDNMLEVLVAFVTSEQFIVRKPL